MRIDNDPIRVLVVDDSPTICRLVASVLNPEPDIVCIGGAAHPLEARLMIKTLLPDVLILDIEMPHMNGLDFLRKIMTLRPMPVLMFSSLTPKGSVDAVEALSIGAVDCLGKTPHMSTDGTLARLPGLVRMASRARVAVAGPALAQSEKPAFRNRGRIILLGSSTGGVDALERVLGGFPVNCPPTLITQHMPTEFLASFAARMNQRSAPRVKIAEDGEPIEDGVVLVAPGGDYHLAIDGKPSPHCVLDGQGRVSGHRPSVDVLFRSAVPLAERIVAGILTGMGSDGAAGMAELRRAGARTLAQDEYTSTVFGMPRVALENGGAERAVPIDRISAALLDLCAAPKARPPAAASQGGMR